MTTADYALVVSLCSAFIALASFGWNVWSKFIYPQPRLVVATSISLMFQGGVSSHRHVSLAFTNHGPGEITVHIAEISGRTRWWQARHWAIVPAIDNFPVQPYTSNGVFGGNLPKRLAVGESHTLRFPFEPNTFLALPLDRIGVQDSFGRHHWAPKNQLRKLLAKYRKTFPDAPRWDWSQPNDTTGTTPPSA